MDVEERFWSRVEKSDGCWERKASSDRAGYGYFRFRGRGWRAHRVSWVMANGEIPEGLYVLHRCDNPPCVRPDHLFLGTLIDNNRDMTVKGHRVRGSTQGAAKLTEERVRTIKRLLAEGWTNERLGPIYGVDPSAIRQIARGETWRHVV